MTQTDKKKIGFLKGVSGFLRQSLLKDRLGYCKKHRVTHTGKICYLSLIDLALYRLTQDPFYLEEAKQVALGVTKRASKGDTTVFLPGASDHKNAANHAIDSGAAVDCLAVLLKEQNRLFTPDESSSIEDAVRACSDTYLKMAAKTKTIPAQRLWAGTGLASAYDLLKDPSYKEAALDTLPLLIRDAHSDGGVPYMIHADRMGEHPGQTDITSYYHSRCLGFAFYILETLKEAPSSELKAFLKNGLDLLLALYGEDGKKLCLNESKQWYWEFPYEVASHSFDIHALIKGWRFFKCEAYHRAAARSFDVLLKHVKKDGGIDSPGANFQCRLFWNSHVAWLARVIDDAPMEQERRARQNLEIRGFEHSGLVSVNHKNYALRLRGAKKPININFGSDVGGGVYTYLGFEKQGFEDQLRIPKWADLVPGSFQVITKKDPLLKRLKAFYQENKKDIRFRLYVAHMEFLGGRPLFSLAYPFRHILKKFWMEMQGRYASHWDCKTRFEIHEKQVVFRGAPAKRSGDPLKEAWTQKNLEFFEDRIQAADTLFLALPVDRVLFGKTPVFKGIKTELDGSVTQDPGKLVLIPQSYPATIKITYTIQL